eukprot:10464882-Alexandrium_andersonii.AAC.1
MTVILPSPRPPARRRCTWASTLNTSMRLACRGHLAAVTWTFWAQLRPSCRLAPCMRACPPGPPKERHLLAGGTFAAPEALVGGSGGG